MGGITTRLWVASDGTTYKFATDMMDYLWKQLKQIGKQPLVKLKK